MMLIPSNKMNLQHKVANVIRKQILSGKLKAGSHFNEAQMAELLGVSRSPIREAIKTLESEGLLETPSTGRTIVVGFTPKDLEDLYDLRFDLEWKAIQPLHKKGALSIQQTVEIEKLLQEMESCTDYRGRYLYLDTWFHRKLIEASNNRPLLRIWSTMIQTILALQQITNENVDQNKMNETNQEHRNMFQSIKEGTPRLTKSLLRKHIQTGVDILKKILEENIAKNIQIDWIKEI